MINGLLGKKVGMTQLLQDDGTVVAVTVIQAGPCVVVQKKTKQKDGYDAVQLAFFGNDSRVESVKPKWVYDPKKKEGIQKRSGPAKDDEDRKWVKRVNMALAGHFSKSKFPVLRFVREVSVQGEADLNLGDRVLVDVFKEQELVHIIGTSKGRGFAGLIKRHHFRGGRASHGSMFHRAPGSIGSSAYPSRVLKGMRMAGHMGNERVTVQNLRVARIDQENNLLFLRGAVPGPPGAYVVVEKSGR